MQQQGQEETTSLLNQENNNQQQNESYHEINDLLQPLNNQENHQHIQHYGSEYSDNLNRDTNILEDSAVYDKENDNHMLLSTRYEWFYDALKLPKFCTGFFAILNLLFIIWGIYCISTEKQLSDQCGESSYLWEYCFATIILSLLLTFFSFVDPRNNIFTLTAVQILVLGLAIWGYIEIYYKKECDSIIDSNIIYFGKFAYVIQTIFTLIVLIVEFGIIIYFLISLINYKQDQQDQVESFSENNSEDNKEQIKHLNDKNQNIEQKQEIIQQENQQQQN